MNATNTNDVRGICARCGRPNDDGMFCGECNKPTPPAPAMPDEVRALVEHCKADAHFPRHLIAAVEAKYGGSR